MPRVQMDAVYYFATAPIDTSSGFRYLRHDEHPLPKGAGYIGRFLVEDSECRVALSKMAGVTVIYPLHRPLSTHALSVFSTLCGALATDQGEDVVMKLQSTFQYDGGPIHWLDPYDRFHPV